MIDYRGNIDYWIKKSEPDYYSFFLKTWIPFNAWYVAELPSFNKKDSKIIKELQDNPSSKPRQIIIDLLKSQSYESIKFKAQIAELHYFLENQSVYHNDQRVSFTILDFCENDTTYTLESDQKGNIYKCEKLNGYFEIIVKDKGSRTILHYKYPSHDVENLFRNEHYIRIKDANVKKNILHYYKKINPNNTFSLVQRKLKRDNCIELKSEHPIVFIKDEVLIAKSIIQILYAVRCMLFHGEIEPNRNNLPLYEHSYYLLKIILTKLN